VVDMVTINIYTSSKDPCKQESAFN